MYKISWWYINSYEYFTSWIVLALLLVHHSMNLSLLQSQHASRNVSMPHWRKTCSQSKRASWLQTPLPEQMSEDSSSEHSHVQSQQRPLTFHSQKEDLPLMKLRDMTIAALVEYCKGPLSAFQQKRTLDGPHTSSSCTEQLCPTH